MKRKSNLTALVLVACFIFATVLSTAFAEDEVIKLAGCEVETEHYYERIADDAFGARDQFALVSGELPQGMVIHHIVATEETGYWLLEGHTSEMGKHAFSVRFFGESDAVDVTYHYELGVYEKVFTRATVCDPYVADVTENGGEPVKCTVVGGELPRGISLGSEESEGTDFADHWFLIGSPMEYGDFEFEIKITNGEMETVKECYIRVNDRTALPPEECVMYEGFEEEAESWKFENAVITEKEDAYEGKSSVKLTKGGVIISPEMEVRKDSLLTWHVNAPQGETYKLYTYSGDEYMLANTYSGIGKWTAEIFAMDQQDKVNRGIVFYYEGDKEITIDFVTMSKGYDSKHDLENAHVKFEENTPLIEWSKDSTYNILGSVPPGLEIEANEKDSATEYLLTGTPTKDGTYSFSLEFLNKDGEIERIERFDLRVRYANPGDLTDNGEMDTGDAVFILKSTVSLMELKPWQESVADMNYDDVINTADAVKILKVCAGIYK